MGEAAGLSQKVKILFFEHLPYEPREQQGLVLGGCRQAQTVYRGRSHGSRSSRMPIIFGNRDTLSRWAGTHFSHNESNQAPGRRLPSSRGHAAPDVRMTVPAELPEAPSV